MDLLPDDTVLYIFTFLTRNIEDLLSAHQVCSRFKNLAEVEFLWRNVRVDFNHQISHELYDCVPTRCLKVAPILGTLAINDLSSIDTNIVLRLMLKHRPKKIRKLSFCNTDIHSKDFTAICSLFADGLEELEMLGFVNFKADRPREKARLGCLPALKTLSTYRDPEFEVSADKWPVLEKLILHYVHDGELLLSSKQNELLLATKRELKILSLDVYFHCLIPAVICDFHHILKLDFPKLEEIVFLGSFTDTHFNDGMPSCKTLGVNPDDCKFCKPIRCMQEFSKLNTNLLSVVFEVECFVCDLKCLKGAGFSKKGKEVCVEFHLTVEESPVYRQCNFKTEDDEFKLLTHVINHFDNLTGLSIKGCTFFLDCSHDKFLEHFPLLEFEFYLNEHSF